MTIHLKAVEDYVTAFLFVFAILDSNGTDMSERVNKVKIGITILRERPFRHQLEVQSIKCKMDITVDVLLQLLAILPLK